MPLTPGVEPAFFRRLHAAHPDEACLLLGGSGDVSPLNRWSLIGLNPRQTLTLRDETLTIQNDSGTRTVPIADAETVFAELETARAACRLWPALREKHDLPFGGGLAGALGYGFARWCDAAMAATPDADWPELSLVECTDWLLIDRIRGELIVLSEDTNRTDTYQALWDTCQREPLGPPVNVAGKMRADFDAARGLEDWQSSFSQDAFETAVKALRGDIAAGEIYQANLSMRLRQTLALDPLDLYDALCARNPSPFSGLMKLPEGWIVCNSPERLIKSDADGILETRPIAGTRGRGKTPEDDAVIGQSLLENEKEVAEHLMLVDLARNDLGRVCAPGSVTVDELLVLERYSHVTHLVSNVRGQLNPQASPWDALRAVFPGGTITGCPKLRCMEILARTEPVPRGFYTGALGYIDAATPAMDWNILIRSAFLLQESVPLRYHAAVHVGAGIVHDSVPAHEFRECQRKAEATLSAIANLQVASTVH